MQWRMLMSGTIFSTKNCQLRNMVLENTIEQRFLYHVSKSRFYVGTNSKSFNSILCMPLDNQ